MESEELKNKINMTTNTCKALNLEILNPSLMNSDERKEFWNRSDAHLWKFSPPMKPAMWSSVEYGWFKWTFDMCFNIGNDKIEG